MATARTILVVDDSPSMRSMIRRACVGPEDTFVEATNGEEAVAAFSTHQPDWAVIDIRMPVMDGLAATREILRQFPRARIVILTQRDEPVWREEARNAGAEEFLLKDDLTQLGRILTRPPDPPDRRA